MIKAPSERGKMTEFVLNLQLFAAAGNVVNTSAGVVNSQTGVTTPADEGKGLSIGMKTYYETEMLENSRAELYFTQFSKKVTLPAKHGRTVEFRKWETLPNADELQEGVIPEGKSLGETVLTCELKQHGMYVAMSDLLDLHHIDPVLQGATEELGASSGLTRDTLARNHLQTNLNVMLCDTETEANGVVTYATPDDYSGMSSTNNRLTPRMVNKAATWLKKNRAPKIDGKYVAIIHPSVSFDLRESKGWVEAHKYASTTEIFNGEIGELHGVRFVETDNAWVGEETLKDGKGMVYSCIFLGKDAYASIDPEGGAMEMIIKSKEQAGGPLNQYSTAGYKFEDCTQILYPERLLRVECCSEFSKSDVANNEV